jgi:hypothetical protein
MVSFFYEHGGEMNTKNERGVPRSFLRSLRSGERNSQENPIRPH